MKIDDQKKSDHEPTFGMMTGPNRPDNFKNFGENAEQQNPLGIVPESDEFSFEETSGVNTPIDSDSFDDHFIPDDDQTHSEPSKKQKKQHHLKIKSNFKPFFKRHTEKNKKALNQMEEAEMHEDTRDDEQAVQNLIHDPELNDDVLKKSKKRLKRERAMSEHSQKKKQKQAYKALPKEERKKLKNTLKEIEKLNQPHKGPRELPLKNPDNIIELSGVVKYYTNGFVATKILKEVDLEIRRGDFVIILGPSGSGKTTLMNIISGLDRASNGITNVNGTDLINLDDRALTKFRQDNVGYVFQQYGLLPNLTVKENVEMGAELQRDKSKKQDVVKILESVGMQDHLNKFPHQLSGGQQQRVSIARAFAKNPTILFGDEPTGAIDEEMSKMVLKEFVNINVNYGTTVIIVTHNPIFEGLGSLVVKIKDGRIAQLIRHENPKTVDELPWGQE